MRLLTARDLGLLLPVSIAFGAGMSAIQPGSYWLGWAGFSCVGLLGLAALVAGWRWAGRGRTLGLIAGLTLLLRLAAGVAAYVALPIDGYDEPDDNAGFIFTDAHRRDAQAWELASSGKPLWSAFDKRYYTDQYGGLLALSALTYRVFSGDAHRPLLILSLAALTAALGVPFFFVGTRLLWDGRLATAAAWLYAVYPESVLTGGAQMREPFLLTFISVAWLGFALWAQGRQRGHLFWLAAGFAGMLLLSPGIAIAMLVLLGVWVLLGGERAHVRWPVWIGASGMLLAAVLLLAWSLGTRSQAVGSPIGIIANWLRDSVNWVIYELERGSGQVQNVFSKLDPATQFLFVVVYGITQPLLPPAFLEPTTPTWRIIGILRALGWYSVLPLLVYAPMAIRRLAPGGMRRVWTWVAGFSWIWILICATRAGGDQWDNPRYRLIFFGFQALVITFAWLSWREHRDAWLPRILGAEALCLILFGQWYLARYYLIGIHFPIMVVMAMCVTGVLMIMLGGSAWDRWRSRAAKDRTAGLGGSV